MNTASEHAQQQQATRVTTLNITIGKLSGIVDDSVQFYWDIITKNTICENSKLQFTFVPAKFLCNDCGNEFEISEELIPCPHCSSMNLSIVQGDEFLLESIEIEREAND